MKTRHNALELAKDRANKTQSTRYIYRVGGQWMVTKDTEEITQAAYKVKIWDYERVDPDPVTVLRQL